MMRTNEYNYLCYIVQVDNGYYWESIAAFNSDTIAKRYAFECGRSTGRKYRVLERNDNQREAKGFVVLRGSLVLGEVVRVNGYWIAKDHEHKELTYRLDKSEAVDDVVDAYKGKSQVRG